MPWNKTRRAVSRAAGRRFGRYTLPISVVLLLVGCSSPRYFPSIETTRLYAGADILTGAEALDPPRPALFREIAISRPTSPIGAYELVTSTELLVEPRSGPPRWKLAQVLESAVQADGEILRYAAKGLGWPTMAPIVIERVVLRSPVEVGSEWTFGPGGELRVTILGLGVEANTFVGTIPDCALVRFEMERGEYQLEWHHPERGLVRRECHTDRLFIAGAALAGDVWPGEAEVLRVVDVWRPEAEPDPRP